MSVTITENFTSIEQELLSARTDLNKLNENIKRIYGKQDFGFVFLKFSFCRNVYRYFVFSEKKRVGGQFDGSQKRNDMKKERNFDPFGKRRQDAFSRAKEVDEAADDFPRPKISSRVITKEQPPASRENALAMQSRNKDLARNKRMFGSLLGTLQKFRNEEDKGVQEKRAKIEMKIEKQQLEVKEKLKKEKDTLIVTRRRKQLEIKTLEIKMEMLQCLKNWEEHQQGLNSFIATKTKPQLYFIPKIMSPVTEALLKESQAQQQLMIEEKRREINEEIKSLESRLEADLQALNEGKLKKSNDGESEASDINAFSDNENNESIKADVKEEKDFAINGS